MCSPSFARTEASPASSSCSRPGSSAKRAGSGQPAAISEDPEGGGGEAHPRDDHGLASAAWVVVVLFVGLVALGLGGLQVRDGQLLGEAAERLEVLALDGRAGGSSFVGQRGLALLVER